MSLQMKRCNQTDDPSAYGFEGGEEKSSSQSSNNNKSDNSEYSLSECIEEE